MKRNEMCAILEKTSDWFNINNKPNFFIPEQEILPVDDYSFTDEEEKLDLVFQVKTKKPKVKSDNPYNEEMKKKMMGYIDGVIKDIEARKNLNKGLEEAYLEVETQKRLINNVEFCLNRKQYLKHHNKKLNGLKPELEKEIDNFLCCMRCREDPEPVVEYDIPPELHSYIDKEKVQKAKEKIEEGLKQTDMRLYYRFKIKNLLASNPTMQPYIEYRFYYKANWHVCDTGTELWIKIK